MAHRTVDAFIELMRVLVQRTEVVHVHVHLAHLKVLVVMSSELVDKGSSLLAALQMNEAFSVYMAGGCN